MIRPTDTIPAYGTLSPSEELHWHRHYPYYWYQYVRGEMCRQLVNGSDAFINANWPLMSKEYKSAVWSLMSVEQQQRIRNVRNQR